VRAGDAAKAAAALSSMREWLAGRAQSLALAAGVAGRFLAAHPDAAAVRERGREALEAAIAAGFDAADAARDPELARLGSRQ
jgi:hypothetical protein